MDVIDYNDTFESIKDYLMEVTMTTPKKSKEYG